MTLSLVLRVFVTRKWTIGVEPIDSCYLCSLCFLALTKLYDDQSFLLDPNLCANQIEIADKENVISWLRLSATLKDFWTISFDSPYDFGLFVWRTFMILNYLYHNTDLTLSMNLSTDNSLSSYW